MALQSTQPGNATFHRFSSLPCELQCHVWHMTFEPREVVVRKYNGANPMFYLNGLQLFSTRPPVAAQVCHEARALLELSYDKVVVLGEDDIKRRGWSKNEVPYVWIDFSRDTLRIFQDLLSDFALGPSCAKVQRLTVEVRNWERWQVGRPFGNGIEDSYYVTSEYPKFPNLQQLDLWVGDKNPVGLRDAFRPTMDMFYGTCNPLQLELRVHSLDFPEMEILTRENYKCIFLNDDICSWEARREEHIAVDIARPTVYTPLWIHSGCSCLERLYPEYDEEAYTV